MEAATPSETEAPRGSTLLMLVQSLVDQTSSEAELATTAANLVNCDQVVLTGNFRGHHIDLH